MLRIALLYTHCNTAATLQKRTNTMYTAQQAQAALALANSNTTSITANSIAQLLNNASVTFAQVQTVTPVATAAKRAVLNSKRSKQFA